MVKKNRLTGNSSRAIWIATFTAGAGLAIASVVALQPVAQAQTAQSQGKSDQQYSQLPEGQGKATLVRVCGKCHTPTIVIANGQARDGWEDTITKMAGLGATASDEEFTEILEYLVKNFPPAAKVNVNKATASELQAQLAFTDKQAEAIIAYRQKNGDFKSPDDLKKVPQMNATDIDTRRNRMVFE